MKSLMQSLRKTKRSQDQGASADAAAAKAPNNTNNTDNATAAPGAGRVKLLAYLRHVTWIIQVARRVPITSVLIVVAWVMWLLARNTSPQRAYGLTSDMAGQSWRFFTSGLTEKTFPALLIATVVLAVLGSAAEYMLGSRQYLGFGLVLQVFSVIGMLVTRDVMVVCRSSWAKAWLTEPFLSQIPWVFGVATVASSHFGRLWRRRLLVVLLVITGSMVLYSGSAADVARLMAVVAGAVMSRTPVRGSLRRSSLQEFRLLIAAAFVMIAAGPLMTSVNPDSDAPLSRIYLLTWEESPVTVREAGVLGAIFNLVPLIIAVVLAIGLARGRRIAWWGAQVFLWATIAGLLFEAFRITKLETDIPINLMASYGLLTVLPWLVLIVVLLVYWRDFRAPAEHGTTKLLVLRISSFAVLVCCLWVGSVMALRDHFEPHVSLLGTIKALRVVLLPPVLSRVFTADIHPADQLGWWLGLWPGPVLGIAVAVFLYIACRSTHVELGDDAKHQRMHQILTTGRGGDHLSWMTLWPGNLVWEAKDGAGYVAYRLHSSTVLTLGEPVVNSGDATAQSLADEFGKFAEQQGWTLAWYSVGAEFAAGRPGTSKLQVAEESIVSTELVTFRGKKFQDVRTARNRAGKEGIRAVWTTWNDAGTMIRSQIRALSEEWVSDKSLPEMGFTLGNLSTLHDPEVRLMLALDEHDNLHGVTSWLPVYEDGALAGWMLDFMRRDPAGFRPVVEFLIAETLVQAHEDGLGWISLSGAPLAHEASGEENPLNIVTDVLGRTLEPLYGFRSLASFKRKFLPEYAPWFLVYTDPATLPAIGLAVSAAYVPDFSIADMQRAARQLLAARKEE